MKLSELGIFFLDLQTTGSRPGDSDILEMAWSSLQNPQIESVLISPSTGFVPRRIQMITGITDSDMATSVSLPEAFEKFHQFLQSNGGHSIAVIHFAQFEKPFLLQAYQLLQKEIPFEMICTHQIAKRLMPNLPTRGIKGLAGYFGYNSGDLKRSASHVEATRYIWTGLSDSLQKQNIHTQEELLSWLNETPATKRKKYEYPLPKETRLALPDQPGVYRMLSRWGEVLYVGKATSLHSRVNSYFRGQKNRDPRKLEMLTQTWDLQVTPCGSPLEAALLETDEIKRLNPRYNISLKTGNRAIVFFNRDFSSCSRTQDQVHSIGPFSNGLVLDSVVKLSHSLREGRFNSLMFFDTIDSTLLENGFALFCERHGFNPARFSSVRSILAVGLSWHKAERTSLPLIESGLITDFDDVEDILSSETEGSDSLAGSELVDPKVNVNSEDGLSLEELLELTAEDIADKFERHFLRAARAYLRARHLTKLLNADIDFRSGAKTELSHLYIRGGQLALSVEPETGAPVAQPCEEASAPTPSSGLSLAPWSGLSIDTYDRMSILFSELNKIKAQDGTVLIRKCSNPTHF